MKKFLFGTMLFAMVMTFSHPMTAKAEVDVDINVSLPPLVSFSAPPAMVVLPETNVYVVPDSNEDIFFSEGWWWRPWKGRWYRSRNYNSGWHHYRNVPAFYGSVPSGWRNDCREHRWKGHAWNYQRLPHQQVHANWNNWERSRHWERQNGWGVEGFHARSQTRDGHPGRAMQRNDHHQVREDRPMDRHVLDVQPGRNEHHQDHGAQPGHGGGVNVQPGHMGHDGDHQDDGK
jgi:hypothetical protein